MPNDTPQPKAVDYSGRPLEVGDTVAYIGIDPVRLCEGRVCVISPRNIRIESGPHFITFNGYPASHSTPPPRPLDGTVSRNEQRQEPLGYPQIALTGTEYRFTACVGNSETSGAVDNDVARRMDYLRTERGGA